MTRIKLVLLTAVAMVVVGALASASASAAPHFLTCLNVGLGNGQWENSACSKVKAGGEWGTVSVGTAINVEGTSGTAELASEIKGTKITIVCEADKFKGTIEKEGKSKAEITYEKCKLVGLSGCPVPNIKAKVLDKLIENASKEIEEEFEQEGTSPFATVVIETCVLKGSYKVTGTQKCTLPKGTEFLVLHEVVCATSGSKLKLETEPATYKGTDSVQLENHDFWAVSR